MNTGIEEVGDDEATYTPDADDRGKHLRAMATYTDRTRDENNVDTDNTADAMFVGFENTAMSDATTKVRNNPMNQAPKFKEGTSTFRVVEENTEALAGDADDDAATEDDPADNVGGKPVGATDADGDTLAYTLGGADAAMFRVRANGQIEVSDKAMLDYEAKKRHTVTVIADDSIGVSNSATSITVTIYVTDLDERPTINDSADPAAMGQQSVQYAEDRDDAALTLTAEDPEGVTPIVWSLLTDDEGTQDLGIFTDSVGDGNDDSEDDVMPADVVDHAAFDIDENGVLTFDEGARLRDAS